MVDLGAMDRVLDADTSSGLVSVEAGITLHALGKRLAELGLAMENQGDIDSQTLAGAISTATHGTGARYRNISSQVAAIRLVTAAGEVVELTEESDPDALAAARVGVGALGAIASVTLRAVPIFTIERIDAPRPLADTLERLDELADAPDHFEFFVFPYADVALTRTSTRSDRPPEPEDPRRVWVREALIENGALDLMCRAGRRFPGAIPAINRRVSSLVTESQKVDRGHNVYATRRDVRFTEMEYGIPREHGAEAVRRVLDLIERRRLPIGFPIEVRVVARRRRVPLHGPRQRTRATSRSTSTRGHGVRDLLPRPSRRSWTPTAGAPTGASATTSRPRPCGLATPTGTVGSRCGRGSTRRARS